MSEKKQLVVVQLTIDASGAERGRERYERAMAKAQAAMERSLSVFLPQQQSKSDGNGA